MESVRTRRRPALQERGWTFLRAGRVFHPFPTALNVCSVLVLALIASRGVPSASILLRLGAAMLLAQAAIGASNDYYDRELDARTKPYKPIVQGLIDPQTALVLAGACALFAGALTATFGLLSIAAGAVGLAAGFAYNIRLKRTILSPLPFMAALPALPFWVWVSLDTFDARLWWLVAFAPLGALAVHLSNTLPDLKRDRAAGVRGLAHRIGRRWSIALAWGSFATALVLAAALGALIDYDWRVLAAGEAAAGALMATAIAVYAVRPGPAALQVGFGLIAAATGVLAAGWLAALE